MEAHEAPKVEGEVKEYGGGTYEAGGLGFKAHMQSQSFNRSEAYSLGAKRWWGFFSEEDMTRLVLLSTTTRAEALYARAFTEDDDPARSSGAKVGLGEDVFLKNTQR